MGTTPHTTNLRASPAPLTQQDRLQIALALHAPAERDAEAANYQELSEEELHQRADALLAATQARSIFLEGEILSKEGFAKAIREQYAVSYRGIVAAYNILQQREGICRDCGEESDELVASLCPECLANYAFCTICQEWVEWGEARFDHRHLYLYDSQNGIWVGSGGIHTESYHKELRAALFAILDRISIIAEPLANTISAGAMGYTAFHFEGPQPGRSHLWCYLDGKHYGDRFNRLDEETAGSEEADLLGLGVRWLLSLDGEDTREANQLTLDWIAAWQKVSARHFASDFIEHLHGDYYEEPLAAKKGMLGMLLSITENLVSCAPADDSTRFDALEEAILSYQNRYPRLSQAMQHYLQCRQRANPEN